MLSAQKSSIATAEAEKAELKAVLESKLFARAPSLVQFLSYVCQKYFDGSASEIKEYSIAVEAFGRGSDFHQKEDPIVRVEANRLRKRLKQYYETENQNHPIQISIPPGQYVPVFHHFPSRESQSFDLDPQRSKVGQQGLPRDQLAEMSNGSLLEGKQALAKGEGPVGLARTWKRNRLAVAPVGIGLCIGVGLVLCLLAAKRIWPPHTPSSSAQLGGAVIPEPKGVMPFSDDDAVRILAGSSLQRYLDRSGKLWTGDRYFTGGNNTQPSNVAILRTPDPEIYQVSRHGDFRYDIPLKPGVYELRLHFAETVYGAEEQEGGGETSRLISFSINGRVVEGLDIISDAGGSKTADVKVFKDISPAADGFLHLNFWSQRGAAFLNALEVLPGIPGHMRPLHITTRSTPYFSKHQTLWIPDSYYRGGRTVLRTNTVTGTNEPELYKSERFGNFTYSFPVAEGSYYAVTLRFAETYFGPTNLGAGGLGSRSFDVYCNGEAILKNLDIFKEAGGENKALEKRFSGLKPNAQGKLFLQFVPNRNYACINAIEVVSGAGSPPLAKPLLK